MNLSRLCSRVYELLVGSATWPRALLLFALFCLCAGVFELRSRALGYANKVLDGRWRGYSPEDVRKFFEAIGEDGRRLYARTERSLDVAFPIIYGSLFATLLILLYGRLGAKYLVLVPLLNVLFDFAENFTLSGLALRFDGKVQPLAKLAAIFTRIKSLLFSVSVLLIALGIVINLVERLRG
ncbi:MAG TPA: hypothetical protein VGC87_24715 [Pyrinomonadaceae bacterium]|jgi:hypothetical protein